MDPWLFSLIKLLNYLDFFVDYTGDTIEEDLLWGVAGRAFFILSYLTYVLHLPPSGDNPRADWKGKTAWLTLLKFVIKNLIIITCAIFLPIFIFSYSIVLGGFFLLISVTHERNILKRIPLRLFGGLFGIIVPIVGPLTLWVLYATGEELLIESISATAAVACVLPRFFTYNRIKERTNYWEHVKRNLWHRSPVYAKVGFIAGIIVIGWVGFTQFYLPNQNYFIWTTMVTMSDGVTLNTAVCFPADWEGEELSVVLIRTPYNIDSTNYLGSINQYVVHQQRILVLQDTRGNYGSKGNFPIFRSEYTDGPDTI
jgi:hypothetical protein